MNMMQTLFNLAMNGGNAEQTLRQAASRDPSVARLLQMTQGKNSAQVRQIAENMCRECGTNYNQMMQLIQQRFRR